MAKSLSIAPGTRVQVFSADRSTNLGIGTYQGEEEIEDSGGLTTLTSHDILVIDTGSQLADCGVNALLKGQSEEAILPIQDWGTVVNWMKAICQVIQNARYCNTIMLCHMLPVETYSGTGINKVLQKTEYFPMAGTQSFSRKFGAYFSTEIFLELRGNKHAGGSSTTYKKGVQTKSRTGVRVEDLPELHMKHLFPFKEIKK
jgi:hypothetical protein